MFGGLMLRLPIRLQASLPLFWVSTGMKAGKNNNSVSLNQVKKAIGELTQ
jgi:hypothetical protein